MKPRIYFCRAFKEWEVDYCGCKDIAWLMAAHCHVRLLNSQEPVRSIRLRVTADSINAALCAAFGRQPAMGCAT